MAYSNNDNHDRKALLAGSILILLVGVYFIGKSIFFSKKDSVQTSVPAIVDKKSGLPLIEPNAILKKIQNEEKIALIDVRSEEEFQTEHLPHSLRFPIGSLANFFPVKDEIVVIVFSESDLETFETAKNIMSGKSFPYFFLKGGFEGWKAGNAPTISSGDPNSFIDQSKITYIKIEDYKKLTEQNSGNFFVLDVQAQDNFKKKHIKGAVNIFLSELEKRAKEIPGGKQIIVYGEDDLASFQAGVRLSDLGFFGARTLTGNNYLSAESGLPLEP